MNEKQLRASAKKVNRLHAELEDRAREIGEELIEVKGVLPYGQFGRWVKRNCAFSDRQARQYMAFARGEVNNLMNGGLRSYSSEVDEPEPEHEDEDDEVFKSLASALDDETPARAGVSENMHEEEDEEVEDTDEQEKAVLLASEGLSYRKIANQLGVDESTVRRDPVVRAAKMEADPESHSSFVGDSHYCESPSASKIIGRIESDIEYIIGPNFHLTKKDRKRLRRSFNKGLEGLSGD